jgi:hypothetical protein
VPYPVRYLISTPQWKDIFINVPVKIDLDTFRRSIFTFFRTLHRSPDPTYQDEHISIEPRRRNTSSAEDDAEDQQDVDQDLLPDDSLPSAAPGGGRSG